MSTLTLTSQAKQRFKVIQTYYKKNQFLRNTYGKVCNFLR